MSKRKIDEEIVQISTRVPKSVAYRVKVAAVEQDLTQSEFIEQALAAYLDGK